MKKNLSVVGGLLVVILCVGYLATKGDSGLEQVTEIGGAVPEESAASHQSAATDDERTDAEVEPAILLSMGPAGLKLLLPSGKTVSIKDHRDSAEVDALLSTLDGGDRESARALFVGLQPGKSGTKPSDRSPEEQAARDLEFQATASMFQELQSQGLSVDEAAQASMEILAKRLRESKEATGRSEK